MREYVALEGLSRADWLEARRHGIGASDAAAILGIDPYRGPLDCYVEKIKGSEQAESLPMRLGRIFEDGIAQAYAEDNGVEITKPTHIYQHDKWDWMLCNPDRFVDDGVLGLLQVKMSGKADSWDDGVPEHIQVQCQHEMAVTGLDYDDVAVFLNGRELRYFRLERDDAMIDNLIALEAEFWARVENEDPPEPDAKSEAALKRLYSGGRDTLELDVEVLGIISDLRQVKAALKVAESHADELSNVLRARLGDYEIGTVGGQPVVRWSKSLRTGFDGKGHEADRPECAALYRKSTPVRTLRLGKVLT